MKITLCTLCFFLLLMLPSCSKNNPAPIPPAITWSAVNNGLTSKYVGTIALNGSNIFAVTADSIDYLDSVYLSTNNGNSWKQINNGLSSNFYGVSALAISGSNIFAATFTDVSIGGVYLSTNYGTSWRTVNNGLPTNPGEIVTSFAVSGSDIFAGTSGGGVYLSTNNGTNWAPVNNGLPTEPASYYKSDTLNFLARVTALAINGNNLFAGTFGSIYRSTNYGTSWAEVNDGLSIYQTEFVTSFAVSGNNIFAGTWTGVYLSTNNGSSWTKVNNGFPKGLPYFNVNALAVSGDDLFAGTTYGVFLSINNGSSWTAVNNGLPATQNTIFSVTSLAISGGNIFAGTNGNGVYISQF